MLDNKRQMHRREEKKNIAHICQAFNETNKQQRKKQRGRLE